LLIKHANVKSERDNSGYRFVGTEMVEVTDQTEITSIEEALAGPKAVRIHFERAVALLSDRRSPDFRNSIKDSISAVEAICRLITNNHSDTLGAAVKKSQQKHRCIPHLNKLF
jgi:hypothetical protein